MANVNPPRYLNHEDVRMRLSGSVIRFQDIPVFADAEDGPVMRIVPLDMNDHIPEEYIDANDERLDISSPPLGYVNHANGQRLCWLMRTTGRQQKQGLTLDNVMVREDTGDPGDPCPDLPRGRRNLLMVSNLSLANTIKGIFPSVEAALDKMQNPECQGIAVSRGWAFVRHTNSPEVLRLKYLRQTVGFMSLGKTPDVILLPGFRKLPNVRKFVSWLPFNFVNLDKKDEVKRD